jgi:hypothetical protein
MHSLLPLAAEFFPAGQGEHADCLEELEYRPAVHAVHTVEPELENLPLSHAAQTELPNPAANVPAAQVRHS